MNLTKDNSVSADQPNLSRRAIIRAVAAATAVAVVGFHGSFSANAAQIAATDAKGSFLQASEFLTRRKLDPILAKRYYVALQKRNPHFEADITRLLGSIDQTRATDADAFLASTQLDKQSLATATTIISAWYLGTVGDDAGVELISYAGALMYEPTHGILVVPSYGGGPNSWGEKPL